MLSNASSMEAESIRSVSPAGNCCHFVLLDNDESCPTADPSTNEWTVLLDRSAVEHDPGLTGRESDAKVTAARNMRIFDARLCRKCINSDKNKNRMMSIPCCTLHVIQCCSEYRTFRDNQVTVFQW